MYAGKKLKQVRRRLNLNQGEFAKELNISQPYYSAIESGKKQITNKIINTIVEKWGINRHVFEPDNNNIPIENMGGNIGGIIGGNEQFDSNKINNLIENSPKVSKVKLFWKKVDLYDKELDLSFTDFCNLDVLHGFLGNYLSNANELINDIYQDIQDSDFEDINNEKFVKAIMKKLYFLKENQEHYKEIVKAIEKSKFFKE